VISRADFADMPRFIRLFDAGLFFIRPSLSKRGSAATKLAEFLGCGVPVIINDGVGDSGRIVRRGAAGVVVPALDHASVETSLAQVRALLDDRGASGRCRQAALDVFDLEWGVGQYADVYGMLGERRRPPRVEHSVGHVRG
jgi:glycosyltransferase involved in cell wall biosynthesis